MHAFVELLCTTHASQEQKIHQGYVDKKAIVSLCPIQLLGSVVFVQPNFLRMVKLDGKINETRSRKAFEPQQQDVDISRPFPKLFIHIKL